jgi:glutathione peroxidase
MRYVSVFAVAVLGLMIGSGCTSYAGGGKETMSAETNAETAECPAALDYRVKSIDGQDVDLCSYKGSVVLVVNVASKCGYTPQYKGLEELYGKYKDRGLRILGFPANDFGSQEPGSDAEIKQFCSLTYGVSFPMFSKISVKGEGQHPLYKHLTSGGGNPALAGDVKWNFQKYLIDREGKVVAVFPSKVDPASPELVSAVEAALK